MARGTWRRDTERASFEAQDGVIRTEVLAALGVSSSVTYQRCRPGGPWQRMLPAVILLHSGPPSWRQRLRAALLFGGPDAQLTGAAATDLYGLRRPDPAGTVQLLLPEPARRRSTGFVIVERTRRLPDPQQLQGFTVAPVLRALLDHARRLGDRRAVQAVLAEAVQRGYCDPRAMLAELDEGSCRGTAVVRAELGGVLGGARSVAEFDAQRVARRTDLPAPAWNVRLVTPDGRYVGQPDAWWDDVALAWEIDSHEFHLSPADHDRTLRRNARYAAHGVELLETLPSRLRTETAAVIEELESAYASAARRPRPDVIVVRPAA